MTTVLIVTLAGLLVGLSKGGLGGPIPVSLTLPLLGIIMPVSEAIALTIPLLIFADIFALRLYWQKWDMYYVRLLLLPSIIGIIMGAYVLSSLPEDTLRRLLGIFCLIVVIYKIGGSTLTGVRYTPRLWHGYAAGWVCGFGSALANVGGPPFTAYMLLQKIDPTPFIGTSTLFFAIVNFLKLPAYLAADVIDPDSLFRLAWVLPIIPLGVWLGRKLIENMNARTFEWIMLGLLLWASVSLIFG
ncbi:MAG: sulfite exporter TauE/SafE family protein [Anaerolineae bacterium]|nr:sulfite exporter TauE/SafE family protein [Anaerolineae bacterium]